jgi:hypothetical protein
LVTPKARAKHDPFVQQTGLWSPHISINFCTFFGFDVFKSLLQNFGLFWTVSKFGNFKLGNGKS